MKDKRLRFLKEARRAIRREMPPPSQVHEDKRYKKKYKNQDLREDHN